MLLCTLLFYSSINRYKKNASNNYYRALWNSPVDSYDQMILLAAYSKFGMEGGGCRISRGGGGKNA